MRRFYLVIIAAVIVLTASCTINQKIAMKIDGSGMGEASMVMHPVLMQYSMDLMESFGTSGGNGSKLFDLDQIKAGFAEKRSVDLLSAFVPSPDKLELKIGFKSLEQVFAESAESGVDRLVTFTQTGGTKKISLNLTAENFNQVAALTPEGNSDLLALFGPQPANPYSEEEYMEMIEYAFYEYTEDVSISDIMNLSFVTLEIAVDGRIISQKGGKQNGNSVVFKIPLIKLLTLNKPLKYEIVFK